MAEGDGVLYNEFKEKVMEGAYNLASGGDTIKVALFSASYNPDKDSDTSYDALSNECSGTGYVAGGATLAGQDVTKDNSNDRGVFDGNDITWSNLGTLSPQPAWAVMYDDTHASNLLIGYWEISTPTNGGDYTIQWSSSPSAIILLT